MRTTFFLLFLFLYITSFSQKNIFINKSLKYIDSTTYQLKCSKFNSKCFSISSKKTDTIINVVYNKYKFGKLDTVNNQIVRNDIYKEGDKGFFIIIHYADTLNTYGYYMKNRASIIKKIRKKLNYSDMITDKIIIKKHHLSNSFNEHSNKIQKNNKKCIKKLRKKNIDLLHYYNRGNTNLTKIQWIKDEKKILKNYFFKFYPEYYFLFLKPSGEYFLAGGLITPSQIKKLVKHNNWNNFKKDLIESIQKNKPVGFFNVEHIHSCL